jgi:stage II sporulation protein D
MPLLNRHKPLSGPSTRWFLRGLTALPYSALLVTSLVILAALFHGCERREIIQPTPQMEAAPPYWVRVLLLAGAAECTIEVPSAFRAVRPESGSEVRDGQLLMASPRTATRVSLVNGRLMLGTTPLADNEVIISPAPPYVFTLNGQDYRGKLKLIPNRDGRTFDAVNLVPLEPYLAGVVGAEMPDYWEPQALLAQAIAARTYCLYVKNRFGVNRHWDVSRTQANQVYGGIGAESAQTWEAVSRTYGQVLMVKGSRTASRVDLSLLDRGLFPAYYSSMCGGHTADSRDVFGEPGPTQEPGLPLKGVPCPYCKDVAKLSLFFWPMVQFDRETVTRQLVDRYPNLAALGEIRELHVVERRDYGRFSRVVRVKLVGATGRTDTLRGEDLRLALDPTGRKVKSTVCQIAAWGNGWAFLSGRGWGHGVGMCQCGAEGMARSGRKAEAILQYYYPGCEIVSAY